MVGIHRSRQIDDPEHHGQQKHNDEGLFHQSTASLAPHTASRDKIFDPVNHWATRIVTVLVSVVLAGRPG
jgi:hypothetical protein